MKKIMLLLCIFGVTQIIKAQTEKCNQRILQSYLSDSVLSKDLYRIYKNTNVYAFAIDFRTGRTIEPTKNKNKKVYPKVGEKMQLIWLNVDTSQYKIETVVTFENKNIENAAMFNSVLKAGSIEELKEGKKEEVKALIDDKKKEEDNAAIPNAGKESKTKNDSTRINRFNIDSLDLFGLERVNKFINERKNSPVANEDSVLYKNANLDLEWYRKTVLRNIKENWKNSVNWRDSIIAVYNNEIKQLKRFIQYDTAKIFILSGEQLVRSVLDFQIQNYDVTQITYKVRSKKDNALIDVREKSILNKNGFKIDFSIGFVGNGLIDENYKIIYTNPLSADTTKIVQQKTSQAGIGFGILAHAYMRTGRRFNYGFASGFALNTNNQITNFMFGGSALMGVEQRLAVTFGYTLGKVKILSEQEYNVGANYSSSILKVTENLNYLDLMKFKPFVAITYNISNLIDKKSSRLDF